MNLFSTLEEPTSFDITFFYIQAHNFFRELFKAIATRTLFPPFAATALIIGDNQVKTFDNKYYRFSGDCDYILTKDFNQRRFSVVANYENQVRKSITIQFEKDLIKIYRSGTMLRNKKVLELPVSFQDTYIHREGNKVTYTNHRGLIIICNLVHHVYTVKISGWYFGRVGGLLGVYDNEFSNEFMTPNRTIANSVGEFVGSWRSPQDCVDNKFEIPQNEPTEWDREKCRELFEIDTSHLFPCFEIVDPKPFKEVCLEESKWFGNVTNPDRGFCQIVSSYIESCKVTLELS